MDVGVNLMTVFSKGIVMLEAVVLSFMLTSRVTNAAESGNLMDIFNTEATRGSLKWLDKFNYVGLALNFIIAAFCFISIFIMVFQKVVTISYFVLQEFWDNAHEIKKSYMGQAGFGMKGYAMDTWGGKSGSGLDAIFHLLYIFVPDVRQMSEMKEGGKFNEDTTMATWFIRSFPSTVLGLLLLSMGFNGSLMKCYGMVVNGFGVVADRVATANSEQFVNNILSAGDAYSYSLGGSGKPQDVFRQNLAREIDRKCLAKVNADQRTSQIRATMGKNIETLVTSHFTDEAIKGHLTTAYGATANNLTDEDFKYVKTDIYVNGTADSKALYYFPVSDVTGGTSTEYVNVFVVLEKRAPSYNYVDLGEGNSSDK